MCVFTVRTLTLELRDHVGQVGLELGVCGEHEAEVVLGDPSERLWWVDAPLVQDAVDAKGCNNTETIISLKLHSKSHYGQLHEKEIYLNLTSTVTSK